MSYNPATFLAAAEAHGLDRRALIDLLGEPVADAGLNEHGCLDTRTMSSWFTAHAGDVTVICTDEDPEVVGRGLHGVYNEVPEFVWEHACRAYMEARGA